MKPWQKKLIRIVTPLLKKLEPVHGVVHAERVFKYCLIFAKDYRKADIEALFAAAYLHDLGQLKLKNGMGVHGYLSANIADFILKKAGISEKKFSLIKQIIKMHEKQYERELSKKKLPIEVFIFHDADKIEGGIGAIGLARQFAFSGGVGKKIWDPNIPRNSSLPYGGNFSAIHTVLDWDIKKKFYTKKGKEIAKERKKYTRTFIKRFFQEWNFKKQLKLSP